MSSEALARDRIAKGVEFLTRYEIEEAIKEFDMAIGLDPHKAQYHLLKGVALLRVYQEREAIVELDEAIKLEPNNPFGHISKAIVLNNSGQYAEAVQESDKAITLKGDAHPNHAEVRDTALSNMKKKPRAIDRIWLPAVLAPVFTARALISNSKIDNRRIEMERLGRCVVTVRQNGAFKTQPYGSRAYALGTTISIIATPEKKGIHSGSGKPTLTRF